MKNHKNNHRKCSAWMRKIGIASLVLLCENQIPVLAQTVQKPEAQIPAQSQTTPRLSRLELHFANALPLDVLQSLQKQASSLGVSLQLPTAGDLSTAPCTLDVQGAFWPVLQEVCQILGLRVVQESGKAKTNLRLVPLSQVFSPRQEISNLIAGYYAGGQGLLLVLNRIELDQDRKFAVQFGIPTKPDDRPTAAIEKGSEKANTEAYFSLFVDPLLKVIGPETRIAFQAVPSPIPTLQKSPSQTATDLEIHIGLLGSDSPRVLPLRKTLFKDGSMPPSTTLKGQATVKVVEQAKKWEIEDVLGGIDSSLEVPCEWEGHKFSVIYTLEDAKMSTRFANQPAQITLAVSIEALRPPNLTEDEVWKRALESQNFRWYSPFIMDNSSTEDRVPGLREALGRVWVSGGYDSSSGEGKASFSLRFYAPNPGIAKTPKLALSWQIPAQLKELRLPFQFEDVPLPQPPAHAE